MIGTALGNYRVVSLLGRGGMGAVYEGVHAVLGRKAAIKVLLPEFSGNAELVDRFFQEARATAGLRHRAFVEVFDSGTLPDGSAYLVMEKLEGESLGAYLGRRGTLPLIEALTLAANIADGVGYAHRHGIVHRDLKPDNVFLARDDDPDRSGQVAVKILDFGIAKLSGFGRESASNTRTGTLMGTPLYMAPEQCRGAGRVAVDHRADIYALGCILHAMLSGQPPFPLEGLGEIISAHLTRPPPPLRQLAPGVPESVESFVLMLLAKSVDARPVSMDGVAEKLRGLVANPGVGAADLGAGISAPGLTQSLPSSIPVGLTVPLRTAGSISTLSSATGAQMGVVSVRGRRWRLTVAGLVATALAGGLIYFRALRPDSATTAPNEGRGVHVETPPASSPASAAPAGPAPLPAVERRQLVGAGQGLAEPTAASTTTKASLAAADAPSPAHHHRVRLQIASEPAGAEVIDLRSDARLGETPLDTLVESQRSPARFVLRKPGFVEKEVRMKLDADASVHVVLGLKPAVQAPAPAAPAPSSDDDDERRKL